LLLAHRSHCFNFVKIAVIGDSLAYGKGDETDGGIAGRVEAELSALQVRTLDISNLGVSGATTADVIARLRQERVRSMIAEADAIVLSIGANDLFRTPEVRAQTLRAPFAVAERILGRVEEVVSAIRNLNGSARLYLLGAYNPVPSHPLSFMLERLLDLWDNSVATRFRSDRLVSVVRMSDIISGPERLSRLDGFHPGAAAYQDAAKRIASMIAAEGRDQAAAG
jgi:lysophospholipase L1-like esterase